MMRRLAGIVFSALALASSPAVAHAEPSFGLVESAARSGDTVHFTISGAEDPVTYSLEAGGREVAEGRASAGAVSGTFAMPDFGATGRSVTVEAEITESDETVTFTRRIQYLPPVQATAPAITQPAPVAQQAPASAATPDPATRKRRPSRGRDGKKRRPKRAPGVGDRKPQRPKRTGRAPHRTEPLPLSARAQRSRGRRRAARTLVVRVPYGVEPSAPGGAHAPSKPRPRPAPAGEPAGAFGPNLTTPLGTLLGSASLSSAVDGDGGGGTIAALAALWLLTVAALALAGTPPERRRRPAGVGLSAAGDEEVLQGVPYVPGSWTVEPMDGDV